jgi:phosphoglycolate phosphatase
MSLNPPADAAIFDFDGVIIDSLAPVATAINGALRAHGLAERRPQELALCIGPPTPSVFAELAGDAEGSPRVAELVATYHELFARVYLAQTRLVDGIGDVLRALAIPLALATAKERRFVGPLLERFGLEFAVVCAPELAEPKADTVARALGALGARDAVVVGDRIYDIDAARANGLRVIAVTWGVGDREELREADVLVEHPEQLLALLA